MQSGSNYVLRVNVSRGQFNIWKDTVYVEYHAASVGRILEGDIIGFRGKFVGIKSYQAVLGQIIQIPHVIADEIRDLGRKQKDPEQQTKRFEPKVSQSYCRSLRYSVGECDVCSRRMSNEQCEEFKRKREECSREGWWITEIGPSRRYANQYADPCPE